MTVSEYTYAETIAAWRDQAEASLRAEDGWLTLAGLFWLEEGENRFGSDPTNDIVVSADDVPGVVGSFRLNGGQVTLEVAPGASVSVNGAPPTARPLRAATEGGPDLVTIGDLTLLVHRSGARTAIRVRDRTNPARQSFTGRRWFPVEEAYRVTATFVPYDPPKPLVITNIVGDSSASFSPGFVTFTLQGQQYQLDASSLRAGGLWLHFQDQTSGTHTYPGGRFLSTEPLDHGQVTLDFNQAVSPPCSFTAFATCPRPLPQNALSVAIEAGERWDDSVHP